MKPFTMFVIVTAMLVLCGEKPGALYTQRVSMGEAREIYHSQEGQDRWLEENVFRGHRNGVFFDVGAYDGHTLSNTLFFERERGWTGVHCEPIPEVFAKLMINRPCAVNLNVAVAETNGEADFFRNTACSEMLSGLVDEYDPRHARRVVIANETQEEARTMVIKVPTRRMDTICEEANIARINYLSIDVEGGEMSVIKSIDFDKVFVDVIGYEVNYADTGKAIEAYLKEKGFVVVHRCLDTIMVHRASDFLPPGK
jgi:FkbM family methyltransferase